MAYHKTYEELIQEAVSRALSLPKDPIQTDIFALALDLANQGAELIWQKWKWDAEKMDQFQTPDPDSDGIITFAEDVERVMAIKQVASGTDNVVPIWPEDEYLAAYMGANINTDRFQILAPDDDLYYRVKVGDSGTGTTGSYYCLALKKYAYVVVDAAYDPADPQNTPLDYRVARFVIHAGVPALRAYMMDGLKESQGMPTRGDFESLLTVALGRETFDQGRERRANPKTPMVDGLGADEWGADG